MSKRTEEPVSDSDPTNIIDVYDAESPENAFTAADDVTTHVNTFVRKDSALSANDVRVLSPDHFVAKEKQRQRREKEPLLYCKLITRWPVQSFLLTLSGHLLMIVLSVGLLASGYDLLPINFESLPLELNSVPWRKRDLAWFYRDEYPNRYDRSPTSSSYRSKPSFRAGMALYYDTGEGNIFTQSNLKKIREIENCLTSVPEYSNYCQLVGGKCAAPISVLRFFDGSLARVDPAFNDPEFDNIPKVLYAALTNNATKSDFQFFLGKSYSITNESASCSITRSMVQIGFPLPGYPEEKDYEDHIKEFTADHFEQLLEEIRESTGEFDFIYRSQLLWRDVVFKQAMNDAMCPIGSISFIFIFILIHTKSMWITCFAVLSIITSFIATNLIYRVVLDFQYIGFFHILTVFIVLGIGADDIYVFFDVWRNTGHEDYETLAHRLSDAYRKSVFSMFFTSLTTAAAFFANAISPLLATRSFGVFSGIVIIVNYISVIVYFPTVVIMYHTHFNHLRWPCVQFFRNHCKERCECCRTEHIEEPPAYLKYDTEINSGFTYPTQVSMNRDKPNKVYSERQQMNGDIYGLEKLSNAETVYSISFKDSKVFSGMQNGVDNLGFVGVKEDFTKSQLPNETTRKPSNKVKRYGVAKQAKKKGIFVRFFRDKYFKFVTHPIIRWLILLVMAGVLAFFIYQASKLEPDNEQLKVLPSSHVLRQAQSHALDSFVESDADTTLVIFIAWGMLERDLTDCHFSTPECKGKQVWDPTFNPSTPEAQLALKALCDKMLSFSVAETDKYHIRRDFLTDRPQVNCFMHNLNTFLDAESISTGKNWSLPYDYNKSFSFMENRPDFYNTSGFSSAYKHFIEVPISYWLSNKYTYDYTNDFILFDHLIGEENGNFSSTVLNRTTKFYGNNIKYVGIQVNTTLRYQTLGYTEGVPIMDKWEEFVKSEMQKMPDGMKNGFQTNRLIWHWLLVQETLANNAIYGIAIGVGLAFPILVIATGNIITGFLATLSMVSSTVCVMGVVTLGGWKLGVIVSLNMCMVVGLTVDYVVHLAEAYSRSLHHDRLSRVKDMLDEMAVSVFFGACTTLGASMFMFIAVMSFFFQFGIFMFSTIGVSLFFSMGMFVTLMGICGPQGHTGNIVAMVKAVFRCCKS